MTESDQPAISQQKLAEVEPGTQPQHLQHQQSAQPQSAVSQTELQLEAMTASLQCAVVDVCDDSDASDDGSDSQRGSDGSVEAPSGPKMLGRNARAGKGRTTAKGGGTSATTTVSA